MFFQYVKTHNSKIITTGPFALIDNERAFDVIIQLIGFEKSNKSNSCSTRKPQKQIKAHNNKLYLLLITDAWKILSQKKRPQCNKYSPNLCGVLFKQLQLVGANKMIFEQLVKDLV